MPIPRARGLRRALAFAALLTLPATTLAPAATAAPPASPVNLTRWFGAEGGFEELACFGLGGGCPGFGTVMTFGGGVGTRTTMRTHEGPLGPEPWPSRTGNRLFMAAVPGGDLSTAALTTLGSTAGPFRGGTLSVALRVHWLPPVPVVIYQHADPDGGTTIRLTLTADGSIVATSGTGTLLGITTRKITPYSWHTLGLTYGPKSEIFRLWLDGGDPQISRTLPGGGPGGHVSLGVVTPTTTQFSIGIDDYVEVGKVDAPIHGARVNYLMPLGSEGGGTWEKSYPVPECTDVAADWQLVSEDQSVMTGSGVKCNLGGASITTAEPGATAVFTTEGIPSGHVPTSSYHRDVKAQPGGGEQILGARTRLRAKTDGFPVTVTATIVVDGSEIPQDITFEGEPMTAWGVTYPLVATGVPWTPARLAAARTRLDGGPASEVRRWVSEVRVDYVWVPS